MLTMERTRYPKTLRMRNAVLNPDVIRAERSRRSFAYFIREFWDCVSSDELHWNWHIGYLANELQVLAEDVARKVPKRHDIIINIPPGTTKSTICTIMFPPWCWTRWFWMRFIAGSYSSQLSLEHAEYSRDLVRHEKFQRCFPELMIKTDKDTKGNFRITKTLPDGNVVIGGNRYSTSVGGTLTGFHGHILLVDDPIDPNRAVSEVELKKANRWVGQTLSTRKIDKAVVPTVLIMQRLHQNDPTGYILDKHKKKIKHICIPAEIYTEEFRKLVKPPELVDYYVDDLLDPVRMPVSVLEESKEDLGQYGYAGQMGQNPTPPGGGMFQVDHLQIIDHLPAPVNFDRIVRYWDKAGTDDGGKRTAGVKLLRLKTGKYIVMDVKKGQWASEKRERIIRETAEADGVNVIIYHEQEPGSGGKQSAQITTQNLAGYSVYADRPTGDKAYRADPYSVQVNNGNVMLLRGLWNHDYIEELRFFPFGTFSDQVDASSGAFTILALRKEARVIGANK